MRIVIDMQGVQNGSRYRGIGRYTLAFAKAIIRNKGQHEVILLLNGLFPDSIEYVRSSFADELPQSRIMVWDGIGPVHYLNPGNDWRRKSSQYLREAFVADMNPDVLIVSSMFEGTGDDSVTSIGEFGHVFTAAILYDLIPLIYKDEYLADKRVMEWYSEKIQQFKKADLWFAISESSRQEGVRHLELPESRVENISAAISTEFRKINCENIKTDIFAKFGITRDVLMYSGATDPRKNIHRLIDAYAATPAMIRESHQLLLAGGMPLHHRLSLEDYSKSVGLRSDEVVFTGRVTDDELVALYNLCKVFILPSFHEGFGLPILEAMACGAPTIGSNVSSIPEVIGLESAMFDPFSVPEMSAKIIRALTDDAFRMELIKNGEERTTIFSWDKTAQLALAKLDTLERQGVIAANRLTFDRNNALPRIIAKIAELSLSEPSETDLISCASAIASQMPRSSNKPKLFVDVSELHRRDSRTGIQRVVRSITQVLLSSPCEPYEVKLVYASETEPYRHATRFSRFLGDTFAIEPEVDNDIIEIRNGDIFLGLDYHDQIVPCHENFYKYMRDRGVQIFFVVYDLLPITLTNCFSSEVTLNFEKWLRVVTKQDGLICISRAVREELRVWINRNCEHRERPIQIDWFHLGGDVENSGTTIGMPDNANTVLAELMKRPTFLMVGTIEPRKGQKQTLAAFELLWKQGVDANLVIVGKQGWMVDSLVDRLRRHPELNKRLFWLEGISDEYLEKIYAASTCLIAASEGEGFGLPLIEAAQHKLPIIARDIPVFREVAGEHAVFFSDLKVEPLAEVVASWLGLHQQGLVPSSAGMPLITWKQSTERLRQILVSESAR